MDNSASNSILSTSLPEAVRADMSGRNCRSQRRHPGRYHPKIRKSNNGSEPEVITNTPTSAQSHIQNTSENDDDAAPPSTASASNSKDGSRPKTPQADGFDVGKLVSLMEEQVSLLRRIDERQAASDLSQQPIPEVPATSNSTWGALLQTTVAETVQPKVGRWRSGLDAIFVFVHCITRHIEINRGTFALMCRLWHQRRHFPFWHVPLEL
ncbi:hypothetical protein C8J57DRAFT_1464451 [Mycena rebaudengoi]|nr:hypothetical protein C8J57DRAFT_1464451 [Mycena rebaudengoi]